MMARTKKPQLDDLLAAVIAKLPPSKTDWPAHERVAWLGLMQMAFDAVYGCAGGVMSHIPVTHLKTNGNDVFRAGLARIEEDLFPFYIDKEGHARKAGGEPINATQVDGILFDQRGEGDLGAIIWADGSKGVLGKVLDIRPA